MRTSVLGIWEYPYPERVRFNAEQVCRITHADPRCLGSCVAVCLAICRLLEGVNSINKLIDTIALEVQSYHPEMEVYFAKTVNDSLEELSLFCYLGESKIRKNTHTAIAKVAGEARKLFMKLINLRNPRWKPGILNTCNQGEIKQ